jgi:hypothetical protein
MTVWRFRGNDGVALSGNDGVALSGNDDIRDPHATQYWIGMSRTFIMLNSNHDGAEVRGAAIVR